MAPDYNTLPIRGPIVSRAAEKNQTRGGLLRKLSLLLLQEAVRKKTLASNLQKEQKQ
jgi:hypothetical protein